MNIKNDIKISKNKYIYQRYNGIIMEYIENDDYYINTETGISIKKDSQILLGEISKNIVDLIEIGDFVNGILVSGKESTLLYTEIKGIDNSGYHIPFSQYGENIKSILTHEQYEQNSYKVGGEE